MGEGSSRVGIKRVTDGHWEWFTSTSEPSYPIRGKYLFFSRYREQLVQIALAELGTGGFHLAKTQMEGRNETPEYVLCLYYEDDRRKHELAEKYRVVPGLKYRYWKSDAATRKGQYSHEFLESLSPEARSRFTRKRNR